MGDQVISLLKKGNSLCSSRSTPMKTKIMKQVTEIHSKCKAILDGDPRKDTPLILATRLGLAHMVWGFIECTKPTTSCMSIPLVTVCQWSLDQKNWSGNTALHVAADSSNVDAVKMLLSNVSLELLISSRNKDGKTPLSLLTNPKYDEPIFACLERTTSTLQQDAHQTSTIISIDEDRTIIHYIDEVMVPSMYPRSHVFVSWESLQKLGDGIRELGPNNDTILHLLVKIGNLASMKGIIEKHSSLMYYRNSDGEVPAFVAAREGHLDILRMMIDYFKSKNDNIQPLMTRRKGKQSALHIAIQNHHVGVVFWLLKEVQGLEHHVNEYGVTPLYVAAEEGHVEVLKLIMQKCRIKPSNEEKGGTALHAAARKGSEECIQYLLSLNSRLLYERDDKQLIPLDVAVFSGHESAAKALLDHDPSLGYLRMRVLDGDVSTVHIAASADRCEILEYLISKCPGCIDITNDEGRNILHVAIQNSSMKVIKFIFGNESLTELINQKDNDRNTPIHLLVDKSSNSNNNKDFNLDITKILVDTRVDLTAVNNKSQTPIQMASSDEERARLLQAVSQGASKWKINEAYLSEEAQNQIKMMDQVVLVAALIATASFAAAFTVPGGFDGNQGSEQGMPILINKFAYRAFVVANALAFTCSCSVLFENVMMLISRYARNGNYLNDLNRILGSVFAMHILTGIAMVTMMIAFLTGTYVLLKPTLGFVIPILSICVFIFVGTYFFAARIGVVANRYLYPATQEKVMRQS